MIQLVTLEGGITGKNFTFISYKLEQRIFTRMGPVVLINNIPYVIHRGQEWT